MRISATACGLTLPSCMPVAFASTTPIVRKRILCSPRPSESFVAALTKHSWMNSSPSKPRPPWTQGLSAPPIWFLTPSPQNKAANASRMPPRCIRLKKTLELIEHITHTCNRRALDLTRQAHRLHHDLQKAMRCFGRQCRGQGQVFVKIVRQTEQQLLSLGKPITALAQHTQQVLEQ